MKKLLPVASLLLLSPFVAAAWRPHTQTQAAPLAQAQGLEARVATLEGELAVEKKRHDETRALLEQTLAYLEKQSKAAQTLLGVLDESEKEGFAVGENWRSRELLLGGMRTYWNEQQGAPKVPPPAKPAETKRSSARQ